MQSWTKTFSDVALLRSRTSSTRLMEDNHFLVDKRKNNCSRARCLGNKACMFECPNWMCDDSQQHWYERDQNNVNGVGERGDKSNIRPSRVDPGGTTPKSRLTPNVLMY
eukprot:GEMP01067796.1.p4 GENE.GEMP01067796.1~~GEMP01067796.1.p4  ORF type:complete len:109 (+),score=15.80 GEMP01067796.1:21-347(+)